MYIREGSKETAIVKKIQAVVGLPQDGNYGPKTKAAVLKWQREHLLVADGIVGPKTLEMMQILDTDTNEQYFVTESGLRIQRYHLPKGEYIDGPIKNSYAFLHHTAGWNNPFKVIDQWAHDSLGRIGTEFVVGGQSITDENSTYDGTVLQAFPEGCTAWHLGKTNSNFMNQHSVGIELCSFGPLKDGKTYTGTKANSNQVSTIDEPFRGYTQWHRYSDAQLKSTEKLLEFIAERDNIDLRVGLVDWIRKHGPQKAFGFNEDAFNGKVRGLLTHTNVRRDKSDCFPQPELIDMLLSL